MHLDFWKFNGIISLHNDEQLVFFPFFSIGFARIDRQNANRFHFPFFFLSSVRYLRGRFVERCSERSVFAKAPNRTGKGIVGTYGDAELSIDRVRSSSDFESALVLRWKSLYFPMRLATCRRCPISRSWELVPRCNADWPMAGGLLRRRHYSRSLWGRSCSVRWTKARTLERYAKIIVWISLRSCSFVCPSFAPRWSFVLRCDIHQRDGRPRVISSVLVFQWKVCVRVVFPRVICDARPTICKSTRVKNVRCRDCSSPLVPGEPLAFL